MLSLKREAPAECHLEQESHIGQGMRRGVSSLRLEGPISLTWMLLAETFPGYAVSAVSPRSQFCGACPAP